MGICGDGQEYCRGEHRCFDADEFVPAKDGTLVHVPPGGRRPPHERTSGRTVRLLQRADGTYELEPEPGLPPARRLRFGWRRR